MLNQHNHQLIDYLDNALPAHEMQAVSALINTDSATRKQWQYLQISVQAIQYAALHEQVAAVKNRYTGKGTVKKMRRAFRLAAVFVLLVTGIAMYKYITTSAADIYREVFVSYHLNTSRSSDAGNALEQAYRNNNWQAVISYFNTAAEKDNKARFLAGMANMELGQYAAASKQFEQVLVYNAQTGNDYFQDEAEYYLAMSCLAQNRVKAAVTILEKIKANTGHLFNRQADRISTTDLTIISFKSDN